MKATQSFTLLQVAMPPTSYLCTMRNIERFTSESADLTIPECALAKANISLWFSSDEEADIHLIDWRNNKGVTPLSVACRQGHLDAVSILLSLGASVEAEDDAGDTPLHYAASYGHLPIISRLLHLGASAFAKNNLGYSPSDVAFSFEVEQAIQDTVRSALEVNKRLRSVKNSAIAAGSVPRSRHNNLSDEEDSEVDEQTIMSGSPLPRSQTPKSVVASPSTRLPGRPHISGSTHPALSISTNSLSPSINPFSTPTGKVSSQDLPLPSPFLDPESSKALQRILARDQNAQAGFQAAAALKSLVGSAIPSDVPSSPYSAISKESGYFSSRPPPSIRRGRSSSNEVTSGSYSSSSATAVSSPSSSPKMATRRLPKSETLSATFIPLGALVGSSVIPPVPPLPVLPHSVLPTLPSSTKTSTSSFVNKLKRTGSASAAVSARPSGMVSPLDAGFAADQITSFGRRSLKHHASLADLRSHHANTSNQPEPVPSQISFISKTTFFSKSRTRSGT